ncbi:MAG: discoidin domain-containing protein [Acidobacteriota bacterium]
MDSSVAKTCILTGVFLLVLASPAAQSDPAAKAGGTVNILSSSHQDIAWMDDPHSCMLYRVHQCISPALELMRKDKNYTFVMENMLNLMEFLEQFPERRGEIQQYTQEGRLEWGATFNQPYESSLSSEELIRGIYFGRRWLKKNFPGCDARVAFNPDVPGRALQMQQILAKAGIPYLVISRYHEGIYRWLSPDGTGVVVYSPGHYGNPTSMLTSPLPEAVQSIHAKLSSLAPYYRQRDIPPVYCLLNSQDFSRPTDFGQLIDLWNSQTFPAAGHATAAERMPPLRMQYSSALGFFEQLEKGQARLDVLTGERPNIWLYIHGPTHHWAISAKRDAAILLPAAEMFSTIHSLLEGDLSRYPQQRITEAWKAQIYPDHGWGGRNGHVTDELFRQKVERARSEAGAILQQALVGISQRVKSSSDRGVPIQVFNTLSWKRSDPVLVDLPSPSADSIRLVDAKGGEVPFQLTDLSEPEEINVASSLMGAKASASSAAGRSSGAPQAIDGKWSNLESDRWVSAADAKPPHWLVVDFGKAREVDKVVIRHEGSLGAYQDEQQFNTTDFQLQFAASAAGPWMDLVPPVTGNSEVLTTHRFQPKAFRFLRLYITRAAARIGEPARVFEVEAYARNVDRSRRLLFVARDVPPIGYKTYYLVRQEGPPAQPLTASRENPLTYENGFYRIEFAPGGIKSIWDKQLSQELLNTEKFLGGEIFTMRSVGNGAGEFPAVQQPTMEGFDQISLHRPEWNLVESGPVRKVFALTQSRPTFTIRQRVLVYDELKRLDCDVALIDWNGQKYREFRMALPLNMNMAASQIAYEVPFGVVEVGKSEIPTTGGVAYQHKPYGSLEYHEQCSKIRPREVQNFASASNQSLGVTISTSVAVFDYLDPTSNPADYPVLQPLLLASRKSCHGEGNWYLQPGNHYYQFSITSHAPGWENGYRFALRANHPLLPQVGIAPVAGASLPEEQSFFDISPSRVLVSTIKKAEDDDSVVVRLYDIEGRDSEVRLQSFAPWISGEWTNIIEEEGKPLRTSGNSFDLKIGHHAIETVKLQLKFSK